MAAKGSALYLQREREVEALVTELKSGEITPNRAKEIEDNLFERFHKVALKIANRYKNNPIEVEDMAVSGMKGYQKALDKYKPEHTGNIKFIGYAAQRIKFGITGAIREHYGINSNWEKHLFSHEAKYRAEALQKNPQFSEDDADRLVAKRFYECAKQKGPGSQLFMSSYELALERVKSYKAKMSAARQVNYATSSFTADDGDVMSVLEQRPDEDATPAEVIVNQNKEALLLRSILAQAFSKLNEREKRVFSERLPRYDDDKVDTTLESLSEELGISRERVRQIFVRAHEKVQSEIIRETKRAGLTTIAGINFGDKEMPSKTSNKSLYDKQIQTRPVAKMPEPELTS